MIRYYWQQLCRKYCKKESRLMRSGCHFRSSPVAFSSCSQQWDPEGEVSVFNYYGTRGNLLDCNNFEDIIEFERGGILISVLGLKGKLVSCS